MGKRWYASRRSMPTIITHPAIPLALGLGLGNKTISPRLLTAGMIACILPDADVVGISLGVPRGSVWAHRGFTHSLAFAAFIGLLGALWSRALQTAPWRAFAFLFFATASHGVLDAFTTGGPGIAFLWPLTDARYFAPWRVVEVSPIGITRFLSARGARVLASEIVWIWLPCTAMLALLLAGRRRR